MKERIFTPLRQAAIEYLPESVKQQVQDSAVAFVNEDRIVTYRQLSDRSDARTWQFDTRRTCEFEEPEYYNELPGEIQALLGTHEYHQPFVIEVPDIAIVGRQGIKITDEGRYVVFNYDRDTTAGAVADFASDVVEAFSFGTWPFASPRGSPDRSFDTVVPLLHRWATNYSHWTEEWLTQFEGLWHYRDQTGVEPTLLLPPDPPSFIRESLAVLGYDENDYVVWDYDWVQGDTVVLPSKRRFWSDTSDGYVRMPSAIQWLRDTVFDRIDLPDPETSPSKILITREDATTRRIVNRDEVVAALGRRGFERVRLTELSYVEQKRFFRHADVVVGTHGAGLTELMYAPDAAVLELFGSYMVPVYFEMANGLGMPYGCLRCTAVGDDIRVDVDRLLEAVEILQNARE